MKIPTGVQLTSGLLSSEISHFADRKGAEVERAVSPRPTKGVQCHTSDQLEG